MTVPKTILLELQFLPPVQYFTKFLVHDDVRLEQWEHYQKGGYRNRCHIAGPNGRQRLSIPLHQGKNQQKPIREVRISYAEPWPRQHWRAMTAAYNNSPFFAYYQEEIRPFFERRYTFLFDFNLDLLRAILRLLGLAPALSLSESFQVNPGPDAADYRQIIHPNLARPEGDPLFRPAPYPQVFLEKNGFLPNLSILDLLFCTGPEAPLFLQASIVHHT